jgi:hypothetical protein
MKKRMGFVSNSSSSSFIIRAKNLTAAQFEQIKKQNSEQGYDAWDIEYYEHGHEANNYYYDHVDEPFYLFKTGMDNFDLEDYIEEVLTTKPDMSKIIE